MPKRYRRRKAKGKVVRGRKLMRDAKKRGINSIAERAVALIAKQQIAKTKLTLISRKFLGAEYNETYNEWADLDGYDNLVDWAGSMSELTKFILKQDHSTVGTSVPVDDPMTAAAENVIVPLEFGVNVIAPYVIKDGKRHDDTVYIKGVSIKIVLKIRNFQETVNFLEERIDIEEAAGNSTVTLVGQLEETKKQAGSWVHMAIVGIKLPMSNTLQTPLTNVTINPKLFTNKLKSFGYSRQLDMSEALLKERGASKKILAYKKVYLPYSRNRNYENQVSLSGFFKKPKRINYHPQDQGGVTSDYKIYFAIRSTIPNKERYKYVKPSFRGVSKLFYYDS